MNARRAALAGGALLAAVLGAAASEPPRRIVSLVPSHTAIVADLGAADRLAGVSSAEPDGSYPHLPRVGGLQPSFEELMRLKPDLVLADTSHRRFDATFRRLGLAVLYLPGTDAATLEEVFGIVLDVGRLLDRSARAEERVAGLRRRVATARARIPSGAPRPRVYFEIWPRPIQGAARVSLRGDLLAQAGAENILPDSGGLTALVSLEWVPRQAPDVILHTGVVDGASIGSRPGWDRIPAVKNGRVRAVDQDKFSQACPRIVDAFEELVDILYGTPAR
jgi:iron complex transport system substrate-binding protein